VVHHNVVDDHIVKGFFNVVDGQHQRSWSIMTRSSSANKRSTPRFGRKPIDCGKKTGSQIGWSACWSAVATTRSHRLAMRRVRN
jgi:hypothetical protein